MQFRLLLITIYALGPAEIYAAPIPASSTLSSALIYVIYIVGIAIALVLLLKFINGNLLFVLLEGAVVFLATSSLLFIVLSSALPNANYLYIVAVSSIATILLIVAKNYRPKLRNLIAITSSIGVGIIIGVNGFNLAYLLMLFIAVYDYIAVFITKHMITLAKAVSAKNLAFLIGSSDVEAIPKGYSTAKDRADFKKNVKIKDVKDPVLRQLIEHGAIPVMSQVQLGTGDLALPLMLTVSAYVSFLNYIIPVMIIVGSVCGLVFTMHLLKKYKVALPAIPPLFAFINLFLGIAFLITKTQNSSLWINFFIVFVVTVAILISKLRSLNQIQTRKGL